MTGTLFLLVVLLLAIGATAHSWVGCTDYRGDVNYYDDSKCHAYPRSWESAREGNLPGSTTPIPGGYQLAAESGYNYQASEGAACQLPRTSPVDSAYTTNFPKAIYEQGQTYCLAWPAKNHISAQCTSQYIPDTSLSLFRSAVNPTADPTQTAFRLNPVTNDFGKHVEGQMDCLGFQRSPKFCENMDAALATGCFTVPADQAVGTYIYQWYWHFNAEAQPYSTCWDAQVVAPGAGRGGGGVIGATTATDTIGTSGSTCRTNWAVAATSAGLSSTTTTQPSVASSSGIPRRSSSSSSTAARSAAAASSTGTSPRATSSTGTTHRSSSSSTGTNRASVSSSTLARLSSSSTGSRRSSSSSTGTSSVSSSSAGQETLRITSAPLTIATTNGFGFDVTLAYSTIGRRTITVDLVLADAPYTWYGKGLVAITPAGTSVRVRVTTSGTILAGARYVLSAWMVDSTVYDVYRFQMTLPIASRDPALTHPWTSSLAQSVVETMGAMTASGSTSTEGSGTVSAPEDTSTGVDGTDYLHDPGNDNGMSGMEAVSTPTGIDDIVTPTAPIAESSTAAVLSASTAHGRHASLGVVALSVLAALVIALR